MKYTWGYIKEVTLAKLDLEEKEAANQNLIGRFPYYANEVITQICSAIKPKNSYLTVNVLTSNEYDKKESSFLQEKLNKFLIKHKPPFWTGVFTITDLTDEQLAKWELEKKYWIKHFSINTTCVGKIVPEPDDLVSWSGDVVLYQEAPEAGVVEASDEEFRYMGDAGIMFFKTGIYQVSYGSRWFTFTKDLDNDVILDMPHDILDCIPSYIAHQCFKIDDEAKSAVFRNEYELFLSRIDDTDFKNTKTLKIGGGW